MIRGAALILCKTKTTGKILGVVLLLFVCGELASRHYLYKTFGAWGFQKQSIEKHFYPNVKIETLKNMINSHSNGLSPIPSLERLKDYTLSYADVVIVVHPTLSLNDCLPILRAKPSLLIFDLHGSQRNDITLPDYFSFFV